MGSTGGSGGAFQGWVELGKAVMALLRDLGLAILLVLLLIWPAAIAGRLETAGFTEGTVGTFKWQSRVKDSTAALQGLTLENEKLKKQLAENGAKLQDLARTASPAAQAGIKGLIAENAQLQSEANVAVATARATLADNQALIAESVGSEATAPAWGVVVGGDPTLAAARDEIERAQKARLPNPRIYFRNNSYRSVSIVPAGDETSDILNRARQQMRKDAYPVRLDGWCSNPVVKEGVIVCV